jgi:hypothetical protein
MNKKMKITTIVILLLIGVGVIVLSVIPKIYRAMDESYQKATDPIRVKHAEQIAGMILEYADKTGAFPFEEYTAERPFMVLIGHSQQEEDEFAQEKVLVKNATFANATILEAELSKVLGRKIVLPRDPQQVATYAPNIYIYFVVKGQMSVMAHLYNPSDMSVKYKWRGGVFYSHTLRSVFSWSSDCSSESSFINSTHPIIDGHYEYVPDPDGEGLVFRGRLTEDLKIDDNESVHLHPDIYFGSFHPGSFTVSVDVWVDDLRPDVLGPYRDKPWLNVVTIFDRTPLTGDIRFEPSVMTNLVGSPGDYFLQTYSLAPSEGGTFFDRAPAALVFPTGRWVSVKVDVDVMTASVRTYQDGLLVSEGPYKSRPGLAGVHMGLYTNRLMKQATVYNRSCAITVSPSPEPIAYSLAACP